MFGRVVGGLDVLTAMERVPTDKDDHPLSEIKITGAFVPLMMQRNCAQSSFGMQNFNS